MTIIILLFLLIIGSLIFWLYSNAQKRAETLKLEKEYEMTKELLRQNPKNSRQREQMLIAGRKYYSSLRNGILSIYDEQAISNDLSAIIGSDPDS
jgi:hypothetical protein